MPDETHDDEIVDEMPDTGGAPCGDIFARAEPIYLTDADDDDDMPAPGTGPCGDPFASSQVVHVTDADE